LVSVDIFSLPRPKSWLSQALTWKTDWHGEVCIFAYQ